MTQAQLTACPFCDFEADIDHEDPKIAPEKATHQVHRHVDTEHPDRTDDLQTYTSQQ